MTLWWRVGLCVCVCVSVWETKTQRDVGLSCLGRSSVFWNALPWPWTWREYPSNDVTTSTAALQSQAGFPQRPLKHQHHLSCQHVCMCVSVCVTSVCVFVCVCACGCGCVRLFVWTCLCACVDVKWTLVHFSERLVLEREAKGGHRRQTQGRRTTNIP